MSDDLFTLDLSGMDLKDLIQELIITDYESGLSANEIAEKYKINPTTTRNNIWNWREKGLINKEVEDLIKGYKAYLEKIFSDKRRKTA